MQIQQEGRYFILYKREGIFPNFLTKKWNTEEETVLPYDFHYSTEIPAKTEGIELDDIPFLINFNYHGLLCID